MKVIYVDEVGYGAIAGPVITCAVAIDKNESKIDGIKDSKKLTREKREILYPLLKQNYQHSFGSASPHTIEKLNIHWARYLAMKRAIEKLLINVESKMVIVDGKFEIPDLSISQQAVIKADDKYWEVGAASILAKVYRDNVMKKLSKINKYSYYGWETNAGYYTPKHKDGIILHGPTSLHRKNFNYFKYCLFCHNKFQEFLKEGKSLEDYQEWVELQRKNKSLYVAWRDGIFDTWKEIPYGEKK